MLRPGLFCFGLGGVIILAASSVPQARGGDIQALPLPVNKTEAINAFRAAHPGTDFKYNGNRIERVFGPAFSAGVSPVASAEAFRQQNAGMFGVLANDLVAIGPFEDGHQVQPIMFNPETGQYKFTGVYYQQQRDGIEVFRSRLMLLTRNEETYPLVLATADVRDIGAFRVQANPALNTKAGLATVRQIATQASGFANLQIEGPRTVIWAGYDDAAAPATGPVLALQYIVDATNNPGATAPWRYLYLVNASTGALLYQENQVSDIDVSGTVKGMGTGNFAAWTCSSPVILNIPFARVAMGGNVVFCDAFGNYTLTNSGSSPVSLTASLQSPAFTQHDQGSGGATTSITMSVTPPGPGNFLFNPSPSEFPTAEVNSFISANLERQYVLGFNPSYPSVSTQTGFPINTNIALTCNAFYSASTLNFYRSGGGCANTGYSSVVYHEYGHNLVEKAGSGQGAYGEGMGDVMSVIMQDTSCLGDGFQGCGNCLRNANNNCQYSSGSCSTCGSEAHDCGQLISGCVWSTRNNLVATNPLTYKQILHNIAINSMLLHGSSSSITPSITVDYLTLDDNDGDITNGTPHYNEINGGFSAHNMPGPALAALSFSYPNGKPAYISPSGGTTMRVVVNGLTGTPQPNTGKLFVSTGGAYSQINMNQVSANVYDAVFPAFTCGTNVRFYVSAQTTTSATITSPSNAPTTYFTAVSAVGQGATIFDDNFQNNQGWTVTNTAGLTTGAWQRGVPVLPAPAGCPSADADGSGQCYVTDNELGNFDVDGGSTTLTSPIMDASQGIPVLSYYRWYNNNTGAAPQADTMVVEFSTNGGSSWSTLETVGPTTSSPNPEVTGGWFQKSFNLSAVPGFTPTSNFRVRFTASDLGSGSVVEAGVDGVKLGTLTCTNPCPSDTNGDNQVNVADLLAVINSWGACSGCPADVNHDNTVNVSDMLAVINGWGSCP